jgi:hypothetical protein
MYSAFISTHLLLKVEPIFNKDKPTCESEGYRGNANAMLQLCNFHKVGQVNDTFVIETDTHRIVYFSEMTKVTLDCPDDRIRDNLIGLHKLPLGCDVETDLVMWPAKQTVTIDTVDSNNSYGLDSK